MAATIGPIATWVCLGTFLLTTFVMQVVLRLPLVPLGVTNVVGAVTCLVSLWLMRAGHPTAGTRLTLVAVVIDTVLDMFLAPPRSIRRWSSSPTSSSGRACCWERAGRSSLR
ncbi:MAG: hypothetical protein IPK33_22805 [Gemmatimonadetes bacterium]|nr:hypothetical protein [Gemmatimonadota bacterium]